MSFEEFALLSPEKKVDATYRQNARILSHLESEAGLRSQRHDKSSDKLIALGNRMIRVELATALLLFITSAIFIKMLDFIHQSKP